MLYLLLFLWLVPKVGVSAYLTEKGELFHPNWLAMYWWLKDKGNYIQMAYEKLSIEQVTSQFSSPTASKSVIDPELVSEFKAMNKGEGLKFPKEPTVSSRKLKVRVNKAAKEAKRVLDWAELEDAFIARVVDIEGATASTNGAVAQTNSSANNTQASTSQPVAATSRRG